MDPMRKALLLLLKDLLEPTPYYAVEADTSELLEVLTPGEELKPVE